MQYYFSQWQVEDEPAVCPGSPLRPSTASRVRGVIVLLCSELCGLTLRTVCRLECHSVRRT